MSLDGGRQLSTSRPISSSSSVSLDGGRQLSAAHPTSDGGGVANMVLMPSAGLLLRDYVHRCLYDRADGYFEQAEAGVGA